jgi:hypothetical protein
MAADADDEAVVTRTRSDAPVALDTEADAFPTWPEEVVPLRGARRGGLLLGLAAAAATVSLGVVVAARSWTQGAGTVRAGAVVTSLATEAMRIETGTLDRGASPGPAEGAIPEAPAVVDAPPAATATPEGAVSPEPPAAPARSSTDLADEARRALERGSTRRAAELATLATDSDPTNATAWLTLGAAFYVENQRGKERWAFLRCVESGRGPRVAECRALLR